MIKINFNLLQILTMYSLNVKHKGNSSHQLVFQLTRIYENFKEQYFRSIQSASWLFESMNDMKEKVNDLVWFHEVMQE